MNRSRYKLSFVTLAVMFGALSVFGQGWPVPAKTPNTDVPCNTSGCVGKEGKKVIGYPDTFKTFSGRFLDSVASRDYQFTFRTARARMLKVAPERNRIYMILGSALAAYDINTFFSRLEGGEDLWPSTQVQVNPQNTRSGLPEVFLRWDQWFYAESGGGWLTQAGDGQERLFGFDWDDRGNVYLAYGAYSWGIVKDDGDASGARMTSLYQHTQPSSTDESDPVRVFSLKSGGTYYLVVSGQYGRVNIFNVTNPTAPTKHRDTNGGPIVELAKSSDGSRIALVKGDGSFAIYTTDNFLANSNPIKQLDQYSGSYASVSTDGTNFYAGVRTVDGKMGVSIFTPNGSDYTETRHVVNAYVAAGVSVRFGAGHLAVSGLETTWGSMNLHIFKVVGTTLSELPINDYYAKHYTGASSKAGPDYTYPAYSVLLDTWIYKKGSKTYLIISDFGLGDVYELKAGDTVTPSVKKVGKTPNPNSVSTANSGPYYGDEITFTATSSGSPFPVTWEWGDGTVDTTTAGAPDVPHQYHGLSVSQLPATRTITAINAHDTAVRETLSVTLKQPTVRVGIRNTSLLFLQPNASAPAGIVSGDEWVDASDGADEGHFAEWILDGVSTKQAPSQTLPVGDCGSQHTLVFTGHYGKRDTSFNPVSGDATLGINGINYSVVPFAAGVMEPTSSGTNVVFRSIARASSRATDLPGGSATACTYTWEIVDASGNLVAAETKMTGIATIATIPDYTVPRATFQGATNWRARLRIAVDPALILGAACKPYASAQAVTSTLSGPDPSDIVATGCANAGGPCSLTVSSLSGADRSSWTYSWSTTGPTAVVQGAGPTYTPALTAPGSYTITVNISNALGDAQKSTVITVAAPVCGSNPTEANTAINFVGGGPSGCNGSGSTCSVGETITFSVSPYGWSFADCDKFTWDFGDGSTSTEKSPTKSYASAGTYAVKLKVEGGLSTANVGINLNVGTTGGGGGNPGGGSCSPMYANSNVYIGFLGSQSGCTASSGNCTSVEQVNFTASTYNYNFSCGTHSFAWNFGDGTVSAQQNPSKNYATNGSYTVSLTITSPVGQVTMTQPITIGTGGGGNPGGGSCPQMVANSNVYVGFMGTTSGCTASSGNCAASEQINFAASTYNYSFGCGTHSFAWSFGDGTTSTLQNPSKSYAQAGSYTVTLTITSPVGQAVMTQPVQVTGGGGGNPGSCSQMVANSNVYIGFIGAQSGCTASMGNCVSTEQVNFTASTFNYNFSCGTHAFEWSFGDGTTSTQQNPSKSYAQNGTYTVTLKITQPGGANVTMTQPVKVGTGGECGNMTKGENVYITYAGVVTACNPLVGTCTDQEMVNFSAGAVGYNFACSPHTFAWDFGDGQTGTGQNVPHKFANGGIFTVKLKITNSKETEELTQIVRVSGSAPAIPATNRRRSTGRR
ncbi:MAG: PKD domain-containing protein [Thermoanaerobaculia bacterium]